MKKFFFGTLLLALVIVFPVPTMAGVDVNVSIGLPPPIVFAAPPEVIVVPDAYGVYAVPDIDIDIFFWNGWWWRPWEGRWYRSAYYDRGWGYYRSVPSFYYDLDPGWRGYYRDRHWHGHQWNYERIPHERLHSNWKNWNNNRYWERQRTWGVQGYQPRPQQQRQELRQQRQKEYQQRPEVQKQRQEQRREVQQPQRQEQRPEARQQQRQKERSEVQQPQRREQRPEAQRPEKQEQKPKAQKPKKSHPQGKPERGYEEKQDRK